MNDGREPHTSYSRYLKEEKNAKNFRKREAARWKIEK